VTARNNNQRFVEAVLSASGMGFTATIRPLEDGSYEIEPLGKRGVWEKLFKALASEADNEYAMIDSTIVRAH